MSASMRPRLAVLLGDPAGVGPEMGVKLLAREANRQAAEILLVAPASGLAQGEAQAGARLGVLALAPGEPLRFEPGRITHLVQPEASAGAARLGECSEAAGQAALQALTTATTPQSFERCSRTFYSLLWTARPLEARIPRSLG